MRQLLIVATLINSGVSLLAPKRPQNCNQIINNTDYCLRHAVLIGRDELKVPETLDQLEADVCATLPSDVRCMARAKRCLDHFPRTLFIVIMKNVKTQMKDACARDNRQHLLDKLQCLRDAGNQEQTFRMLDFLTAAIENVLETTTPNNILPSLCCTAYYGIWYANDTVSRICPQTAPYLVQILRGLVGEVLDIACGAGKYSTLQLCETHLPEVLHALRNLSETVTYKTYSYSPVIPLIKAFEIMDT